MPSLPETAANSRREQSNFLTDLAILSGLVYNYGTITHIISEETMYESVVAQKLAERGLQQGIQQGLQQGQRQQSVEDLLDVLDIRFDARAVEPLKPKIEAIEELHILKQLHRSAVQVADLYEFQRILDSIVQS